MSDVTSRIRTDIPAPVLVDDSPRNFGQRFLVDKPELTYPDATRIVEFEFGEPQRVPLDALGRGVHGRFRQAEAGAEPIRAEDLSAEPRRVVDVVRYTLSDEACGGNERPGSSGGRCTAPVDFESVS